MNETGQQTVTAPAPPDDPQTGGTGQSSQQDTGAPAKDNKAPSSPRLFSAVITLLFISLLSGLGYWGWVQKTATDELLMRVAEAASREQNLADRIQELEQQTQDMNDIGASTRISVNQQNARLDELNEELAVLRLGLNSAQISSAAALLSEAASSLRIAQQYLALARDLAVARTLYQHSLELLNQVEDPAINNIQAMLLADIGALDNAQELDIQGLYLRLTEVSEQIADISLVEVSEAREPSEDFLQQAGIEDEAEQAGLWSRISEFLGRYFTVRRQNEPFAVPLSPGQVIFLRQNMQLQIEQAKLALLQGRADVYQESISRVITLAQQNIPDSDGRRQTVLRDLRDLQAQPIIIQLPRLSNALTVLESMLNRSML